MTPVEERIDHEERVKGIKMLVGKIVDATPQDEMIDLWEREIRRHLDALLTEHSAREEQATHLATTREQAVMNLASLLRERRDLSARLAEAEAILSKAQAPVRADGTYNFSREAFEQMANDYFALTAAESAQPESSTSVPQGSTHVEPAQPDRPAGHEGQHEVFTHDLAWGPVESPPVEAEEEG